MSRNAFVPMTWITSDLNGEALRTLILISTYADGKTGECHPSNALLGKMLGKCDRAIRKAVAEIESSGFVSIHQGRGRGRTFRIETPEWYAKPGTKRSGMNPEQNVPSSDQEPGTKRSAFSESTRNETFQEPGTKRSANPERNVPGPNKNTVFNNGLNTVSNSGSFSQESKPVEKPAAAAGQNLEPFESGLATRLPEVRNGFKPARQSQLKIAPTQFDPATVDRIYEVLGTDGDDFAGMVSQEQADAGFVEWVLRKSETAKKPIGLAVHLLNKAWRQGWTNPNAEEDAQYAEMVEIMRRIQQ
jgi:biotin operon repressor